MNLCRLSKLISFTTLLALIYINMQMQIIDLAYQGKIREKNILNLREDSNLVTSSIVELKSANHLGIKLLTEGSTLQFRDRDNTKKIITSMEAVSDDNALNKETQTKSNPLLSFLSLRTASEAQAQTTKKKDMSLPWLRNDR